MGHVEETCWYEFEYYGLVYYGTKRTLCSAENEDVTRGEGQELG